MKIVVAQIKSRVAVHQANLELIQEAVLQAQAWNADLIIFPELALSGYLPEDVLFRSAYLQEEQAVLSQLLENTQHLSVHIVLGHLQQDVQGQLMNTASVIHQGQIKHSYYKQQLPNYGVFDEQRYFNAGDRNVVFDCAGHRFGLLICEDGWQTEPGLSLAQHRPDCVIQINASPFEAGKIDQRLRILQERCRETRAAWLNVHCVGAQDELLFDGGSQMVLADGTQVWCGSQWQSELTLLEGTQREARWHVSVMNTQPILPAYQQSPAITSLPHIGFEAELYQGLCVSLYEYVKRNQFTQVILGLSGGIDSALTLAIAVDTLGASAVNAVMLPSRYTSDLSHQCAQEQLNLLGVAGLNLSIEPAYEAVMSTLAEPFKGLPSNVAEENIQARCRAILLMALSNKTGALVLTTGNKSEIAVGYCTLYGDMSGGFNVLKDVYKTQVYALARWRNKHGQAVPEAVITRAPSAELRLDQTDQDSLPAYEVLDAILKCYIEADLDAAAIIEKGFAESDVNQVIRLIKINEYKRRQAAPGPKVSARAFGRDWRMPLTVG